MVEKRFAASQLLFDEGDPSDVAYVIRSGRVEISKATEHGPVRLAVLGEGDVVGEMGLLEERPRSASARALEAVVADAISPLAFSRMLVDDPKGSMRLLHSLFERLRTMNRRVMEYETRDPGPARARVTLVPLTPETAAGVAAGGVEVSRFPYRVGRKPESHEDGRLAFNDLQLADTAPFLLALNHFALDLGQDGVLVRDRGSQHGTEVNGVRIGATATRDVALLHEGENEVIAGPAPVLSPRKTSPFRFRVVVGKC
jgi:CRP-like cAMP-binding protein